MRLTQGTLLKTAKNEAVARLRRDRHLVCIYLTGSMTTDSPLLGGATDIDLVIVHSTEPEQEREIVRVTDEVHLDIAHYPQMLFRDTRRLRVDPWLGSYLCLDPLVLHDSGHWFDFVQASVCAQFNRPETRLQRLRPFFDDARGRWLLLSQNAEGDFSPSTLYSYFKALENAANAVASLVGGPLTERRFLLHLPDRTRLIRRPELFEAFLDLFLPNGTGELPWQDWFTKWEQAFLEAGQAEGCSARLHPARLGYYLQTMDVLKEDYPAAALWLLLRTWTQALCHLTQKPERTQDWINTLKHIGLTEDRFSTQLDDLDSFLDAVEESLDNWAYNQGLTPLSERL